MTKILAYVKDFLYVCSMKKGDTIRFLGTERMIYDNDGEDVYGDLTVGEVYEAEDCGILFVQVLGKLRLKEYFRKMNK